MKRPEATAGLRHVALNVKNLEACERFYVELLGMQVEWRPDADNETVEKPPFRSMPDSM